jgi:hypothetical protein
MPITLSKPFLLSDAGSTRASAYDNTNKAVRVGEVTHVTWLDAVSVVRYRSFDHCAGTWSEAVTLGEGADNHCNPALTATPDGVLRLAYGPHGFWDDGMFNHGRFRLLERADGAAWAEIGNVGYGATYASLITDSQGRDHLAYRGGEGTPGCFYERRVLDGNWDLTTKLSVIRRKPDYSYVNPTLAVGPGDVLYAGFMYYYLDYSTGTDESAGVCALKSPDGGETWTGLDGRPARLPLPYDPDFAIPHIGVMPYLGSLAVDADGNLVAFTHDYGPKDGLPAPNSSLLSVWRAGGWQTTALDPFLPAGWSIHRGNVTVDAHNRILVAVDATHGALGETRWGDPSLECFLLASEDGGRTFACAQISETNPNVPNWLPNISRTGSNHDLRTPLVLYTQGVAGSGCAPEDRTQVFGVWVE